MANTTRETGESNLFKVDNALVFVLQIAYISIPLYIKAPDIMDLRFGKSLRSISIVNGE